LALQSVTRYILQAMSDQLLHPPAARTDVPERFDPATMQGEIIEAEHLARYRWACSLAVGRRVLDAGCGTAYGSSLLAEAGALEVVGVDTAREVLDYARARMPELVALEDGDVTALPYEDGRFDLVVCFEVIEHLAEPGRALDEFRRVLSPQGVLAVSSPNRDVYPPGNPHHLNEYVPAELERDLLLRFACVRLERQHTWITSGVLDDARFLLGDEGDLGSGAHVRKLAGNEPGAELYTVALAGHEKLPEPAATFELAAPVELRKWDALWQEQAQMLEQQAEVLEQQAELLSTHGRLFAEHTAEAARLQHTIHELRDQLARTESELARLPALEAQLQELLQLNDELLQLNHELQLRQVSFEDLAATAARYTVLVESTSWKLTRPLRQAVALARRLSK
jgi:2-polyprenyl-3-methyl-5-hydroxy-6-metoxy-1,4-benzoquinol methylase